MVRSHHDTDSSEEEEHPLFTLNDRPVFFHLYTGNGRSAFGLSAGQVQRLTSLIQGHGGLICANEVDADTIIVKEEGVEVLRQKYWISRDIYVEPPSFVHRCIRTRRYKHAPPVRKGLGGRPGGSNRQRVEFSELDDECLCRYLAHVVPYAETGGRMGNEIYKRLMELGDEGGKDGTGSDDTPRILGASDTRRKRQSSIRL
ncbi:hypothetical protein A0H81_04968 [Grifola frondosa]|uniref:BRCT domain-containing protein n=1 Tax=Grifola frondosa TaxID=5627 RepID=A0A1C7MG90_GRIFR|nr:hypothetical protein A0H81_04968 [Grifola frondosa]